MREKIIFYIRAISRSFDDLRQELDHCDAAGVTVPPPEAINTYFERLSLIIAILAVDPDDLDALASLHRLKVDIDGMVECQRIRRLN